MGFWGRVVALRLRCWRPPPHWALQAPQEPQEPTAQSMAGVAHRQSSPVQRDGWSGQRTVSKLSGVGNAEGHWLPQTRMYELPLAQFVVVVHSAPARSVGGVQLKKAGASVVDTGAFIHSICVGWVGVSVGWLGGYCTALYQLSVGNKVRVCVLCSPL